MAVVIVAVPPEGALPVCPQCRRYLVEDGRGGWLHEDDATPRCPEGLALAVRAATAILSGWTVTRWPWARHPARGGRSSSLSPWTSV